MFGVVAVSRDVLPATRTQGASHIFNISSAAGVASFAGASAYSTSKFAVEGLSEALAQKVAPMAIKLIIVEPSYFRTEFPSPPLRFSVGEDSVGLFEHTLTAKAQELAACRSLSVSLAHDE